jgi:hypothetical protein
MSTFTVNKGLEQPARGSYNSTWDTPVNADWAAIDTALGGNTQINVTGVGTGTYTLTLAQYQPPNIVITGTITGPIAYALPIGVGGIWTVFNNTTGAFPISFASQGGGALNVPHGTRIMAVCDGVNMQYVATAAFAPSVPTAKVGLTAIAGSANTYTSSDSAPAIDQSIAPTWTGVQTFNAAANFFGGMGLFSALTLVTGVGSINATGGTITVGTAPSADNSALAASTAFVKTAAATAQAAAIATAANGSNITSGTVAAARLPLIGNLTGITIAADPGTTPSGVAGQMFFYY